jgi:predicted RNA methylase
VRADADVLDVLRAATTDGNRLVLNGQLDRKLYERADAAIKAAGGKWNRTAKAHVFPGDAVEAIAAMAAGENVVTDREQGFFPTPPGLAASLVLAAQITDGQLVLEPSAGEGMLVRAARQFGATVDAYELNPGRCKILRDLGLCRNVWEGDFLSFHPATSAYRYDAAVMNPPFGYHAELRHVEHAAGFVKPGGMVAAILPASLQYGRDKLTTRVRERVERDGAWTEIEDGQFAGTGVRTVLAVFEVRPPEDEGRR